MNEDLFFEKKKKTLTNFNLVIIIFPIFFIITFKRIS